MKQKGTKICPLAPAHLTGIAAFQISITFAFFSIELALIPLALFILLCLTAPFLPRFNFFLPIISHGKSGKNTVTLTFDDGPDPKTTLELLKILSEYSVKATFFVTGKNAEKHPELIREILSQGHSIGNHSYSHDPILMLRNGPTLYREIESAQNALKNFGITPLAFRPPAGVTNPRLWRALLKLGMYCVNYNCRAFDGGNRRVNGLAGKILKKSKPGDIILLHDIWPAKKESPDVWLNEIRLILSGLKDKGLSIIPLPEMTGKKVMEISDTNLLQNPITAFYNELAHDYANEQFHSNVSIARKKEFHIFLSRFGELFSSSHRALEIGAGTGIFTIPIAKKCREVVAVDISHDMLEILKMKAKEAKLNNINIRTGDIEKMELEEKYNTICSFSTFEYIGDLKSLIDKLVNHLEPGGILYFTTAHRSLFRLFTQLGNAMRQGLWLHAWSKKEISRMLDNPSVSQVDISTHLFKSIVTGGMLLEVFARKND